MNKWLIVIIVILGFILGVSLRQGDIMHKKYNAALANVKAYDKILSETGEKNLALELTVNQLRGFNDSTLKQLDAIRKQLKIKDKEIKALQAISSSFTKKDTVFLKDTLFRDPSLKMDTLIGDAWYNIRLGLEYPSTIAITPTFKSEKYIVVSNKKETVNPPKKFWLFRLFQRKHIVVKVDVVEKNPYAENEKSTYIDIIK